MWESIFQDGNGISMQEAIHHVFTPLYDGLKRKINPPPPKKCTTSKEKHGWNPWESFKWNF